VHVKCLHVVLSLHFTVAAATQSNVRVKSGLHGPYGNKCECFAIRTDTKLVFHFDIVVETDVNVGTVRNKT